MAFYEAAESGRWYVLGSDWTLLKGEFRILADTAMIGRIMLCQYVEYFFAVYGGYSSDLAKRSNINKMKKI